MAAGNPRPRPRPQYDVEQFYVRSGFLLPRYHQFYWIGLTTQRNPDFGWTDGGFKAKKTHCKWRRLPDAAPGLMPGVLQPCMLMTQMRCSCWTAPAPALSLWHLPARSQFMNDAP